MSLNNGKYDQIVVSKSDLLTLCRNAFDCIGGLKQLANGVPCFETSGINAGDNIIEVSSYLYKGLSRCLSGMNDDWNFLNQAVNKVISFDQYMAYEIKDSTPKTGRDLLSQITSGEYRNVADFITEQRELMGNPVGPNSTFSCIRLDHENIEVDSEQLNSIEDVPGRCEATIDLLHNYSGVLNDLITTDCFQGEFAGVFKDYLDSVHKPLIVKLTMVFLALKMLTQDYINGYDALYGSQSFMISEVELDELIINLEKFKAKVLGDVRRGNSLVGVISDRSHNQVNLCEYSSGGWQFLTDFKIAFKRELGLIRLIETSVCDKLKPLVHDADSVYVYSRMLKRTSGLGVLSADKVAFLKVSSSIKGKVSIEEYLNKELQFTDGKLDPIKRDELLEIIKQDPKYADKVDKLNSASDNSLNGLLRYYCNLIEITPDINKKEAIDQALNSFAADPSWLAKVYYASLNSENVFLNTPNCYIFSVDNKPEEVRARALARAKEIVKKNEYGYSQSPRWDGPDHLLDCASLAVIIFMDAGVPVPGGDGSNGTINFVTSTMDKLTDYGFVRINYADEICDKTEKLEPADILVSNTTHGHAEVYVDQGRSIHATSIDGFDKWGIGGDETGKYLEYPEGHTSDLQKLGGYLKGVFGEFFDENYLDEEGLPVIGEICAHRITHVSDPKTIIQDTFRGTQWEDVYRYTGGVPLAVLDDVNIY